MTISRAVLIALAAALLLASPAGAAKKKTCKDAKLIATGTAQEARIERATRCLINQERTKRGLKRLTANAELLKSSDWQANDMLEHQYFDHTRPGGPPFAERILRFGYAENSKGYAIAENLAWATSTIATPTKIVSLWMHSPEHRKNILTRGYRDQAISALWSDAGVGGAYSGSGGPFLIFVNQFGVRY